MINEIQFILRLQDKNDEAWTELVHQYYQELIRFCARFVGNRDEAKDLAHDTLCRAMGNISKFDTTRFHSIKPWLLQIAKTTTLKYLRYKRIRGSSWKPSDPVTTATTMAILKIVDCRPGPRTHANDADKFRAVYEAVDQLPEIFKQVMLLHYVDGLTRNQIAELLEIPENTVKSRLRIALKKLRSILPNCVLD